MMLKKWVKEAIKTHTPRRIKATLSGWASANSMELMLRRLKDKGYRPSALVDVGAYEGEWTRLAKSIWASAAVWMFEAQEDKMKGLDKLVERMSEATAINALLGAEEGKDVTFYAMGTGSSIFAERTSAPRRKQMKKMRRLDSILADGVDLKPGVFMKIDVQGAEMEVLRGATGIMGQCEFLLLECSLLEYNRDAPLLSEVIAQLGTWGYVPYDIASLMRLPSGELNQVDMLFCSTKSAYRPTGDLW